ncbi:AAEL003456-PA [Aedes aegypti]|uniref:AAEL003456-PA n=1 Tax=Aedes aegypti TaxID=7159 RepID=Q17FB1_AEDAE|nr:AAEL003456-PA [Aedes aegypti]
MDPAALHEKKMKISAKLLGLCRTCLTAENESEADLYPISDIFLEEDELTSQVQSFEEVLCLFVDNEVGHQKDRLPKIMCLTCIEKARSAFQFIEMCRQTDTLLLELLNDHKEEQDTKPIINDERLADNEDNEQKPEIIIPETTQQVYEQLVIEETPMEVPVQAEEHLESEVVSLENQPQLTTKQKRMHVCDVCQKSFTQSQTLNRHKKIHSRDSEPGKVCGYCARMFLRSDDLRRHIRTHTNERPYACDHCNKAYKQSFELKEHKALAHPESGVRKYLSCTICNKQLTTRNGLYVHMKAHRGEKNHACIYCEKRFITTGELSSHMKHIHPSEVNAEQFPCGVGECMRKFVTKAALRHHRNTKHGVKDETKCERTDESD